MFVGYRGSMRPGSFWSLRKESNIAQRKRLSRWCFKFRPILKHECPRYSAQRRLGSTWLEPVSGVLWATYSGCALNKETDMHQEINRRLSTCMTTLKRLDLFWLHGTNPVKFKVRVYNAIIRSKLMYGLETAQLNPAHIRRLEVFQMKGFRKNWDTKRHLDGQS